MKAIHFLGLFLLCLVSACTDNSEEEPLDLNKEVEDLIQIHQSSKGEHLIEFYAERNAFYQGYNEISLRLKSKADGRLLENVSIDWTPIMKMTEMSHSCPHSALKPLPNTQTLHSGFALFQMPGNSIEKWHLKLDYQVGGENFSIEEEIDVRATDRRTSAVFMGSDQKKYVLAYAQPMQPEVKVNDFNCLLYRMESMMSFVPVSDFKIAIDPRMPGMGNHGSPNNADALYDPASKLYKGKVSFTMSGFWRINMMLYDAGGHVLKGEQVTDERPESSLYFEIEF